MDERLFELKSWLSDTVGLAGYTLAPASADASFRRYFRITLQNATYIAMDAPPRKEDTGPFLRAAGYLQALGLNVPRVLAEDRVRGFLLLSDLGRHLYLDRLNAGSVERLYGDALGALVILQAGTHTARGAFPPYDQTLLRREMSLFRDWYLGRHLGLTLDAGQTGALEEVFTVLTRSALEQPRVWVHRDFHSRNLMVTERNNPGILDFQDAVCGPVTYDLVSLLRDCYIAWPRARVEDWVNGYYDLGRQSGLPVGDDKAQFLEWFDRMGVQRHLKAIGIFARLNHRDGKPGYLGDIPRVLDYVIEASARYRDLQPLHALVVGLGSPR